MFNKLSQRFANLLIGLGKSVVLFQNTVFAIFQRPLETKNIISQMLETGVRSLPVTSLTSLFTGMVLALQTGYSSRYVFNEPLYVGTVVAFSLIKELAPVLTAVVVTGRVGAAITAELGTMKVTEQIDALYTLGTNPVKYLAVPRFVACVTMIPILTILSNVIGVLGGFIIANLRLDIPSTIYWSDTFDYLRVDDFFHGFIKSAFFASIIALVSIHKGFECRGGAEGVGKATTSAVVTVLVLILVSDYFLSALLVAFGIG
ncbi:MAG: ABC transporter permease [Elusimicrobiota bacterium]|nr:ABC transporter permease [Elusimicrobiota bacterium]